LTQNWKGTADIDAVLPRSRYAFGDAKAGGTWVGSKLVGAIHSIDLGPAGPEGEGAARKMIACFASAGVEATYQAKMIEYLWVQFALTGGLWPSLVKAGSFSSLLGDWDAGYRSLAAVRECFALLERRGVCLEHYPDISLYRSTSRIRIFLALTLIRVMFSFSEWAKRTSSHALNDPREVRAFYFDILEMSEALGFSMPVFTSYRSVIEAFAETGLH